MDERTNLLPNPGVEAGISAWLHRKSAAAGVPLSGTFELTRRCNFRCRMCYIHKGEREGDREGELTAGQWIDLGRQAADAGMLFLLLTGGEPLLREDFPEIYTRLGRLGLSVSVNTNGSLLGRAADLFERIHPTRLNVSLYGASGETYRALCGADRFAQVKENLERMIAAGIDVRLNVSVTPENGKDLEGIFAFAAAHRLHIKATSYMYPPVRAEEACGAADARLSPEEAGRYRVKIDRLQLPEEEFRRRVAAVAAGEIIPADDACIDPSLQGSVSRCRAGRAGFWVDWRGGLRMCGMTPVCADLTKMTFAEGWQAVRRHTLAIRLPAVCTDCALRRMCPVCAAACYAETGDYGKKPEYLCRMTAAAAEEMRRLHLSQENTNA